ncbi:MAG: YihY/virulence factor BrkB family protein [Actinomycetota bacterium]|nr:YihY/virulence factor BrkB family protein [Actinomycetota bacterium]
MLSTYEIKSRLLKRLWARDLNSYRWPLRFAVLSARLSHVAVNAYQDKQLSNTAMSLVYTTFLSLVPFLALSFSVLTAFGVQNQIAPYILTLLAPFGEQGRIITGRLLDYINHLKIGVLGTAGLVGLLYTSVSLIQKIENALNYIWKSKQTRSLIRRFTDYLSVILIGPVLVFTAFAMTSAFMNSKIAYRITSIEAIGPVIYFLGKLTPYFLVSAAFAFMYAFLPTTRVSIKAAFTGGVVGGILWQSASWLFAEFTISSTSYPAIYSGIAILLLFAIWTGLNWQIFLIGAAVSFHMQYPQFPFISQEPLVLSARLHEKLSLLCAYLIADSFYFNKTPWSTDSLVVYTGAPLEAVQQVLNTLAANGFITKSASGETFVPARPVNRIKIAEVAEAARAAWETEYPVNFIRALPPIVEEVSAGISESISASLKNKTVEDLVTGSMATERSYSIY